MHVAYGPVVDVAVIERALQQAPGIVGFAHGFGQAPGTIIEIGVLQRHRNAPRHKPEFLVFRAMVAVLPAQINRLEA